MSLAIALTQCQERLAESGRAASAEARKLKGLVTPRVFDELMLQLCNVAAEANKFKTLLGTMRMLGELDQQPPAVTVESLELAECVPMLPRHALRDESAAFALELQHIGDDTLSDDQNVLVKQEGGTHG